MGANHDREANHSVALAAAACGTSGLNTALSQGYPSRPITLIVPYPAGGPTDSLARLLIEHMRGTLGQSIVIENVQAFQYDAALVFRREVSPRPSTARRHHFCRRFFLRH